MAADEPRRYASGREVVAAVIAGDVDWGLVDHFELWRALATTPDAPIANFFMPAGDASGFVNLTGAGVLSDNPAAVELVRYLLSDAAQRRVGRETFEYPLVAGIEPVVGLPPLAELDAPDIDFREVSAQLEATREAIQRSGLAQ
jgi:iron(III) transport system substrate-binding protein